MHNHEFIVLIMSGDIKKWKKVTGNKNPISSFGNLNIAEAGNKFLMTFDSEEILKMEDEKFVGMWAGVFEQIRTKTGPGDISIEIRTESLDDEGNIIKKSDKSLEDKVEDLRSLIMYFLRNTFPDGQGLVIFPGKKSNKY